MARCHFSGLALMLTVRVLVFSLLLLQGGHRKGAGRYALRWQIKKQQKAPPCTCVRSSDMVF